MAAPRATNETRSRRRSALIVTSIVVLVIAAAAVFQTTRTSSTSGTTSPETQTAARAAAQEIEISFPTDGPTKTPTQVDVPEPTRLPTRPTTVAVLGASIEAIEQARSVAPAPLGTFLVVKPAGGVPLTHSPSHEGRSTLEIPVYDEPFGEPRVLVYDNLVDGLTNRHPLVHYGQDSAPLVLRVLAGGPGDDWIQVQAPVLPHGRTVWVQALYFEFEFTPVRIEIDLAGQGHLRVIDGGAIMIDAPIVQGRPENPTPRHVTYVAGGRRTTGGFGAARVALASFEPRRGNPGVDQARTFIHGNTEADAMGTAISMGNVRVPDDLMLDLAAQAPPGTPVLIFDSSDASTTRDAIVNPLLQPADTISFYDEELLVGPSAFLLAPQMWEHCASWQELICARDEMGSPDSLVPVGNVFLTARPDAGQELVGVGDVVPVYDEPHGPKRLLVDYNEIDLQSYAYPPRHPTLWGQPLVLNVLQGAPGDEWALVQAPVRPHRQSVWVRSDDFTWGQTLTRIEVDLGERGLMTVFDRNEPVISSLAVYGRDSRPTTLHDTYVEQAFEGKVLSPAYGTYILTLASYSEVFSNYGGGGMPAQSLHGTNQPDLIGMAVSSGGIRVPDEVIDQVYAQPGIVGAGVIIFDSTTIGREAAIQLQRLQTWFPARTTTFPQTNLEFVKAHSYS